jgi:hypothetical protein
VLLFGALVPWADRDAKDARKKAREERSFAGAADH